MQLKRRGIDILHIILLFTIWGLMVFLVPAPKILLRLIGVTAFLGINLILFNLIGIKWLVILLLFSSLLSRYEIHVGQFSIRIEHLSAVIIGPGIILSLLLNSKRSLKITQSLTVSLAAIKLLCFLHFCSRAVRKLHTYWPPTFTGAFICFLNQFQ